MESLQGQGSQAGEAVQQVLGKASCKGCNNSGREQLVAALPAQLDAQGWDVQQSGWSNKAVRV
ncbi:hypothetical protein HaLaN_04014 [Haematococcus lacustris]|uniref:Uncharacterized protein n=1 Tax=Haematococcus lacustris TaxID=44745 RepID=A0A699YIB8_HAELA|nr:hypothetical protein HaLaN_04014 [Haematococcus lacustris]